MRSGEYYQLTNFNFAANNPIIYTDADGRKIKIANNVKDALTKLAQIAATTGGRNRLNSLIGDRRTYSLNKVFFSGNSQFDPSKRQIDYPSSVWRFNIDGGDPGATFILGHEIDHAFRHQQGKNLNRKQAEIAGVNFGNYLRDVYGKSKLRNSYQGVGRISTKGINFKNEKVTNFQQKDDLSTDDNSILGFSYNTSTEGGEEQTEYIISATAEDGTFHYTRFDNEKDYKDRITLIKEVQENKKKDEE